MITGAQDRAVVLPAKTQARRSNGPYIQRLTLTVRSRRELVCGLSLATLTAPLDCICAFTTALSSHSFRRLAGSCPHAIVLATGMTQPAAEVLIDLMPVAGHSLTFLCICGLGRNRRLKVLAELKQALELAHHPQAELILERKGRHLHPDR